MYLGIAIGVLVLLFGVLSYFAAKTWHVGHVVLLFGVFLAAIGVVVLSAMTLQTHKAWRSKHKQLTEQVEREEAAAELIQHGDLNQAILTGETLPELQGKVEREILERGRVWRGVIPAGLQENAVTINLAKWGENRCETVGAEGEDGELDPIAQDDPAAPAAAKSRPHNLTEKMIVHAFLEAEIAKLNPATRKAILGDSILGQQDKQGFCKVPVAYLGQFYIPEGGAKEDAAILTPLYPLDSDQIQAISNPQNTWVLYEKLPPDGHDVFTSMIDPTVDPKEAVAAATAMFRTLWPPAALGLDAESYNRLIDQYARDQQLAQPGDPEERTQVLVKFTKDYTIDVDVEGVPTGETEAFDSSGRAKLPHLIQGEAITFAAGDTATFDSVTANRLIREGVAERADEAPEYVRALRDYGFLFRNRFTLRNELDAQIGLVKQDSASVLKSAEQVNQRIASGEAELAKLKEDAKKITGEEQAVASYKKDLDARRATQRQQLSELYRTNVQLQRQLQMMRSGRTGGETAHSPQPVSTQIAR